jgi:pantoate--beta-alanine ligase
MSDSKVFVPTMGSLHAGHLSLIELAKNYSSNIVVSIFVNPLQFENPEDLATYPRDIDGDALQARGAGATEIWTPTVEEIYPGAVEKISSGALGKMYEGAGREGHFDGVLTVVDRLFRHVQPQWAIFGEKDFQQLFIIKKWVKASGIPIEIIGAPLIRDVDGVALSSRNIRLSKDDRKTARVISRALRQATVERSIDSARDRLHDVLASEPGFKLDYAEIINEDNFEPATSARKGRALVAGWVNGVRLLDNMSMSAPGIREPQVRSK